MSTHKLTVTIDQPQVTDGVMAEFKRDLPPGTINHVVDGLFSMPKLGGVEPAGRKIIREIAEASIQTPEFRNMAEKMVHQCLLKVTQATMAKELKSVLKNVWSKDLNDWLASARKSDKPPVPSSPLAKPVIEEPSFSDNEKDGPHAPLDYSFSSANIDQPLFIFDLNHPVPVYDVWLGYIYLGTITQIEKTFRVYSRGKTWIEVILHFNWGMLLVEEKRLRRLKKIGRFRSKSKYSPYFAKTMVNGQEHLAINDIPVGPYHRPINTFNFKRLTTLPDSVFIVVHRNSMGTTQ